MSILLAMGVGAATSYAAITVVPKVLPASTISQPYVRGAMLVGLGGLSAYALDKLGYRSAGLAAAAVLGGAGIVTAVAQLMSSMQTPNYSQPSAGVQVGPDGTVQGLGAVEFDQLGAIELNAVELGAIEAQVGDVGMDDPYYGGSFSDDYAALYT